MAREKETYRLELEQILAYFGDKRILTLTDVATYVGKTRDWTRSHLGVTGEGVTAVKLAYILSNF